MKAAICTLGCKVNQYESQQISQQLTRAGYLVVSDRLDADVYIINSCAVTGESARKTRQTVRRLKSKHPEAVVVLTGCVPQAFPDEAFAVKEADIVTGNRCNDQIPRLIEKYLSEKGAKAKSTDFGENFVDSGGRIKYIVGHEAGEKYSGEIITNFSGHTRAFVKIQDGCDRFCSYCAIPFARGRSRSKSIGDIEKELESLALNGFKEVVFSGINLSAYGRDIGLTIADAVKRAENTDGIERVRLSSIEPDFITRDIINSLAGCEKFCPQFHISLQSGSDAVLKRMNRHYNCDEYRRLTQQLRSAFDDVSLTTDIIVGFPGETREEFEQTVDFVKEIRFEKVHVFPFSPREGTKAAKMPDAVPNAVKSERAAELSAECEEIRREIFSSLVSKTYSVLFEKPKDGYQRGYTGTYVPVAVRTDADLQGKITDVKIVSVDGDSCMGVLV